MAGKQHYTRNTISVTRWCNRCLRMTPHQVAGGRVGHCLEQHTRPAAKTPGPKPPQQMPLFSRWNV